jgi:hypothetical protein
MVKNPSPPQELYGDNPRPGSHQILCTSMLQYLSKRMLPIILSAYSRDDRNSSISQVASTRRTMSRCPDISMFFFVDCPINRLNGLLKTSEGVTSEMIFRNSFESRHKGTPAVNQLCAQRF